jgi:hypothetical protein
MSNPSYASLHAGLLARKGEARPVQDPQLAALAWQPAKTPPVVAPVPSSSQPTPNVVADMKVRLQDVATSWPARKPVSPIADDHTWVATKAAPALDSFGHPVKTTVRLTHAQARAVKLAALVLDRPQQDILASALMSKLEALACSDLAKCSCFQAVVAGLDKDLPAVAAMQPAAPAKK